MVHASGSLTCLGETNNPMQAFGVQCGKETDREAQVAVGASGVHPNQTQEVGAEVRPSLGQETLELSLEG